MTYMDVLILRAQDAQVSRKDTTTWTMCHTKDAQRYVGSRAMPGAIAEDVRDEYMDIFG